MLHMWAKETDTEGFSEREVAKNILVALFT